MFSKLWFTLMTFSLSLISVFSHAVTTTCMNYESFPLGASYPVGTSMTFGDIQGELVGFQWSDGTWFSGGLADIENFGMAMGSGQEVNLNNINQRFIFNGDHPTSATLKYADWGGNVNLGINGILNNVADMSDLNGMTVAGVLIVVSRTETFGGHHGIVSLVGVTSDIERFAFGGQEFWVDDACVQFP